MRTSMIEWVEMSRLVVMVVVRELLGGWVFLVSTAL